MFFDPRVLAIILASASCVMIMLSSVASPPKVRISQVPSFDDGSVIVLFGVVVDMSVRDSGSECLVLADASDGATVKVYCNQGLRDPPSRYLSIGDEVRVLGEVSGQGSSPILFASCDDVSLWRSGESALTVGTICRNWVLFEGDSFSANGLVIPGESRGSFRLADPVTEQSISLRSSSTDLSGYLGKRVTVVAVLRLDQGTMSLVLAAQSISPGSS